MSNLPVKQTRLVTTFFCLKHLIFLSFWSLNNSWILTWESNARAKRNLDLYDSWRIEKIPCSASPHNLVPRAVPIETRTRLPFTLRRKNLNAQLYFYTVRTSDHTIPSPKRRSFSGYLYLSKLLKMKHIEKNKALNSVRCKWVTWYSTISRLPCALNQRNLNISAFRLSWMKTFCWSGGSFSKTMM